MGNNGNIGWLSAIVDWEAFAGEGIGVSKDLLPRRQTNFFGRRLLVADAAPLEFASGLSMSGIRSAAFVSGAELISGLQVLEETARHQAPLLVYVYGASISTLVPLLSRLPCFVLSASNAQDAIDQAVLARRVTEMSLLPGVILLEHTDQEQKEKWVLPNGAQLTVFPGSPDEAMECPTPAQEILFGRHRSRVPRWFNFDLPALHGSVKNPQEKAQEALARQVFLESHLDEILERARMAFKSVFGRNLMPVGINGATKAEGLVLVNGLNREILDQARERDGLKARRSTGTIEIKQWRPFPAEDLQVAMQKARHITVVEAPGTGFNSWLRGLISIVSPLEWHCGTATGPLHVREAEELFKRMDKGDKKMHRFIVGASSAFTKSGLPQYEVLLQRIKRAYPELESSVLAAPDGSMPAELAVGRISRFVRQYQDGGPPYARLSHFAQHAVYSSGVLEKSGLDPFKALPLIPAATSALKHWGGGRVQMPVLAPELCTACGICPVACPHAALPGLALNLENILKGGMDISTRRGAPLSALTPMVKNLARAMGSLVAKKEGHALQIPEVLAEAFLQLADQMGLHGEKREQARQDVERLAEILAPWPAVVTEGLFRQPESGEPGNGLVFAVVTDPVACTGCGICADACPEKAIRMMPLEAAGLQEEVAKFELWEELPDMADTALEPLLKMEGPYAVSALYWNRRRFRAMAGGAKGEEGHGSKALLHAFQTVLLHLQLEKQSKLEQQVRTIGEQLAAKIHTTLSDALPKKVFSDLSEALAQVQGAKAPLDTLLSGLAENAHLGKIDADVLRRQMELLAQLQNLAWLLQEGPSGAGRATFGLLFAGNVPDWLGKYPCNHFTVPVFLRSGGDYPAFAIGLMEGQIRHFLDNLRLVRRGMLEVKGRYQASEHDAALSALSWADLSEEEKQGIPPLAVLFLGKEPVPALLFQSSLPLFPVRISDGKDLSLTDGEAGYANLLASAFGEKQFTQSSLGHPGHFFQAVKRGFQVNTPGLLQLLAPEIPGRDILSASRLALQTRAFPLLYTQKEDGSESGGISLDGNPAPESDWVASGMALPRWFGEKGEYTYTYVDWLNAQPEREVYLQEREILSEGPVQVSSFLELDGQSAKEKSAVLVQTNPQGSIGQPFEVAPGALTLARMALRQWRMLQDWAGSGKGYWEKREAALEARHQIATQHLKEAFERQLLQAEEKWKKQTLERLRDKLVQITKTKG